MRLGLNLSYSGSALGVNLPLIQEADRLGFHSVWSAEAYGSDAVSVIAWQSALKPLLFQFDQIDWSRTFVFWFGGPGLLIGIAISMVAMAIAGIAVNGWGLTVVGITMVDEI